MKVLGISWTWMQELSVILKKESRVGTESYLGRFYCSLSRKAPSRWGVPNNSYSGHTFFGSRKRIRVQFHLSGKKWEVLLIDIYLLGWVPRGSLLSLEESGCEAWRLALNLSFSTDGLCDCRQLFYFSEPWFSHLKLEIIILS